MSKNKREDEVLYQAYKDGLYSKPKFIPYPGTVPITDSKRDAYVSLFQYNTQQKELAESRGSFAGIRDVTTNKVFIDLDSKEDLELARHEALKLVSKLIDMGVDQDAINVSFTGSKGYSVELTLDKRINNEEFKTVVENLAGDLKTFDRIVSDPARIVRVVNTRHNKTDKYKIPLELYELDEMSSDEIKELAKTPRDRTFKAVHAKLPADVFKSKEPAVPHSKPKGVQDWDLQKALEAMPRGWKPYKYALLLGYFEAGERHMALMVVAATAKGLGFDREIAIKLCESAIERQAARTKSEPFDQDDLVNNIIDKSVYSSTWEGGQFSPTTNPWLKSYCERMGFEVKDEDTKVLSTIDDTFALFKSYADNIDALTVKTGIAALDKNLRMTVGMSVGILAPAGAGKTSLAIQILNNMSKAGHKCLFFSYDMYSALVYQKLLQKHFGVSENEAFEPFVNNDEEVQKEIRDKLNDEYKNVDFCFKPGQSVEDIVNTIKESEQRSGQKVRLIIVDYNELVLTDKSDNTAASSFVAQKLREIANVHQICVISLYQPNKAAGGPSDEMLSYHSAKGSGAISQSVSVFLGVSRPGFSPKHPEDDKFLTINCLKNRMGRLFSLDLHWDGAAGSVRDMTEEEKDHLNDVRRRRAEEAQQSDAQWS